MASLISPGVSVSVTDQSFYTPAAPGTVPLIVVATAQNKLNAAKTATAPGTLKTNIGKIYSITSQKDLVDTFGVPYFELTATNNPVHGGERNEYGLLAAYSLLGVTSNVFIMRADVDLDQLVSQTTAPGAYPTNGQWWLDTHATAWGILEWNGAAASTTGGQTFKPITPIVLTNDDADKIVDSMDYDRAPAPSVGTDGSYAVIVETGSTSKEAAKYFFKRPTVLGGGWHLIGSDAWRSSWPTVASSRTPTVVTGDAGKTLYIAGQPITLSGSSKAEILQNLVASINALNTTQGISAQVANGNVYIYYNGQYEQDVLLSDDLTLEDGTGQWSLIGINLGAGYTAVSGTFYAPRLVMSPHTQVPAYKITDADPRPTGSIWIKTTEPNFGSRWRMKRWSTAALTWSPVNSPIYANTHSADYYLDRTNGGGAIPIDTLFVQNNADEYFGGTLGSAVAGVTVTTGTSSGYTNGAAVTFTAPDLATGIQATGTITTTNGPNVSVVSVNDTSELITTATAHNFVAGQVVRFGSSFDSAIATGTNYYVLSAGLTTTDFKVSTTSSGSPVDLTTNGSVSSTVQVYGKLTGVTMVNSGSGYLNTPIVTLPTGVLGSGSTQVVLGGAQEIEPVTAKFRFWRKAAVGKTNLSSAVVTSALPDGAQTFTIFESQPGSMSLNSAVITTAALTGTSGSITDDLNAIATAINNAAYNSVTEVGLKYIEASVTSNKLTISHTKGGEIRVLDTDGVIGSVFGNAYDIYTKTGTKGLWASADTAQTGYDYLISSWEPLAVSGYIGSKAAPSNEAADGTLWYNASVSEIDLMVHDGNTWRGYREIFPATDPAGPMIKATKPADGDRSDGNALVNDDIWISTANLEVFPTIYRYTNAGTTAAGWTAIDVTDQTSESGILFADARYGLSGVTGNIAAPIADYYGTTGCSYLDFDAPDPALYPRGMILWNTRRSTGNVKQMHIAYVNKNGDNVRFNNGESQANYDPQGTNPAVYDRWVTASPNDEFGTGQFGRHAQRAVVVKKLKSMVDTNQTVRDEERINFNILACPGYPELLSNLVNLNIDRGQTGFVIGDTPLRLSADATSLITWGSNQRLVTDNGDKGIVTYDPYSAVFYPNGFTTDLGGNYCVVPASHMLLKTITLSDNVSYPWFAPAGTRRGGITNATAVGYIDAQTGEFQTVALNNGQRDTLYNLDINPVAFFNGVGLVNYGQKTRSPNASALDRINVARLVVYLRTQLNKLARPYIFEPNDKITRDEIKQSVESLLLELVGLRALYDFAVVCDTTNNTPARIDRNELWVDIAISPVKAVEFIYIPLRIKNTGAV